MKLEVKASGKVLIPNALDNRSYTQWRAFNNKRAYVASTLFTLFSNLNKQRAGQMALLTHTRVYRCLSCGNFWETPQHSNVCPNCKENNMESLRWQLIREECPLCGGVRAYDTLTFMGQCKCRRWDLLADLFREIQSLVREGKIDVVVQALVNTFMDYHVIQHNTEATEPQNEQSG